MKWPAVVSCLLFLVASLAAQLPLPTPNPTPNSNTAPSAPSPQPTTPVPTAIPALTAPAVNSADFIPVVITYGNGSETRAQITRGTMQPVGIPPSQPVTVTLFLSSGIPGTLVRVGLYDGGQIAAAITAPNPDGGNSVQVPAAAPILVLADQTVRFNFQAGGSLGLYRVLVTIGPKQYLLQFYAARPRTASSLSPLPSPSPTISPPISTPP